MNPATANDVVAGILGRVAGSLVLRTQYEPAPAESDAPWLRLAVAHERSPQDEHGGALLQRVRVVVTVNSPVANPQQGYVLAEKIRVALSEQALPGLRLFGASFVIEADPPDGASFAAVRVEVPGVYPLGVSG